MRWDQPRPHATPAEVRTVDLETWKCFWKISATLGRHQQQNENFHAWKDQCSSLTLTGNLRRSVTGHLQRWSEVFRGALPRSLVHRGRLRKNRPPWPSRLYSISSFCTTALLQFTTSEGNSPYMYNLRRTFGDSTYCHCVREKECQFGCPCSRAEMEAVCGSEAVVGSTAHQQNPY